MMTPSRYAILLLLLAPALGADDFREAKQAFKESFRPGATAKARLDAVRALSAHDGKDAAKLLLSGIPVCESFLDALTARRAKVAGGDVKGLLDGDPLPELSRLKEEIAEEMLVLASIEKAVSGMRSEKTVTYLLREALFKEKSWRARRLAAEVVSASGDADAAKYLLRAIRDKDARVRISVALALGSLKAEEALSELVALLDEEAWTVRAAAVDALREIGGVEAVDALIPQLARETGRLREDCAEALRKLTGQAFGDVPTAWERWWSDNRESFGKGDGGAKAAPKPEARSDDSYYGLPILTDRAIFVLDISESMSYSSVEWQEKPKPGEISRLELAKREFARAIAGFNSKSRFNVLVFHSEVEVWQRKMVPAGREMQEAAKAWVRPMEATGTTNIYGALETAFSLVGMGAGDRNYDLAADTIYLLSDGAPTNEDLTDDDPLRILRAVRIWNRLNRIRIHTIGLKGHDAHFMSKLAEENGGKYVSR